MVEDKIFIGGCREGKFHEGQTDVTLFVTGEDIAKITQHANGGKGTFKNKEGKTVVKLRIQTSKGGKLYCEIDQFEPRQQESIPSERAADPSDLPF